MRCTQGKLREGSGAMGTQMLRCAQHDKAETAARPLAGWRRDQQPVRYLDRGPGGPAEHASLQMSAINGSNTNRG